MSQHPLVGLKLRFQLTTSKERGPPMQEDLKWKRISNGRRPTIEDNLQRNTTSNGRWPPIEDDLQLKTTSNGKWPLKKDNLQDAKMTSNSKRSLLRCGRSIKRGIHLRPLDGFWLDKRKTRVWPCSAQLVSCFIAPPLKMLKKYTFFATKKYLREKKKIQFVAKKSVLSEHFQRWDRLAGKKLLFPPSF